MDRGKDSRRRRSQSRSSSKNRGSREHGSGRSRGSSSASCGSESDGDGGGRASAASSAARPKVTPRQLAQLVQLVPVVLLYLRDVETSAGDLFLDAQSDDAVQLLLHELLDDTNMEGDLSMAHLRKVASSYMPEVCASAVRIVILESEPRFIRPEVGEALVNVLGELDSCETGKDCARMIGPLLDELPRTSYFALAELCAFLRDSTDPSELACLIGPALFTGRQEDIEEDHSAAASAAIMDLLIEECDLFFGRMCSKSQRSGLGERRSNYFRPSYSGGTRTRREAASRRRRGSAMLGRFRSGDFGGHDGAVDSEAAREAMRMQQLVTFYNWRDPLKADLVPSLFANHDFVAIAQAVFEKYPEAMPVAWRHDLAELKESGAADVSWFPDDAADASSTLQRGRGGSTELAAAARRSRKGSSFKQGVRSRSPVDRIIDEVIETEHYYHDCLMESVAYARHIQHVARGYKGAEAKKRLGLDAADIEKIFGFRMADVLELSTRFLARMDVIDLVRSEPHAPEGRAGLLADAVRCVIDEAHVYAPYVSMHKTVHNILKEAGVQLKKRPSGGGAAKRLQGLGRGSHPDMKKFKGSFGEIWDHVASQSSRLRGQQLESVLIMPIQRVPRYKLLFQELAKALPQDHPAYAKVREVSHSVADVAAQINRALKQHEKLAALLGDEELQPSGSKRGVVRTGSAKNLMKNVYKNASGALRDRDSAEFDVADMHPDDHLEM